MSYNVIMMRTNTENLTTTIPAEFAGILDFKLSKIANRAAKKGMAGKLGFTISEPRELPKKNDEILTKRVVDVTVTGVVPKIEGWEFHGKLTHDAGDFVTVLSAPGKEVPAKFRKSAGECDHCNKIRSRKDTFVLFNGTDHIEVGRTCLKDFFPHINVAWVIDFFNFIDEMNNAEVDFNDMPRGCKIKPAAGIKDLLALSNAIIRRDGWMSKGAVNKILDRDPDANVWATSGTISEAAWIMLFGSFAPKNWEAPELTDADAEMADKVIEFVRNDLTGDNEFVFNLKNFFRGDTVEMRFLPFVAAAIPTFKRTVEKAIEKKAAKAVSNHIGTIGDKITADVEVTMTKTVQSHFGASTLLRFVDTSGNTFVTFSSGKFDPEIGTKLTIIGTVKSHDDFKGFKSTMLKRVKEAA